MAAKSTLLNARKQWILVLCLLVSSALLFFHQVLAPGQVMFSNDGPIGELMSACHQLPARFTGCWENVHGVGNREGAAIPNISFILQWLLQPVFFSKFYAPLALVILGMSAWAFFRELKLAAPACILGGLAAMLQSAFFSVACWGVAAHTLTIAMTFLALAALTDTASPRLWLRTVLAGLCVGMGVAEGADVGALCSIFVVVYVIYQVSIAEGPRTKSILLGAGRVGLMAVCAALLAACAVSELVNNDIKDIHGTQQDATTRAERWNWATQWSLPKREALGIIVPGLFGYRLETGDGSDYWGAIGRAAEWNDYFAKGAQGTPPTEKYLRNSGTGYYSGVLVMMLAVWALAQSLRKDALFNTIQRRWIWFWSATVLVSLLLAFGRYAPFYRLIYALPYFSTIRNPIKYLYFLNMALVVLFAFGIDGLWRGFVNKTAVEQKRTRPGKFENMWLLGSVVAVVLVCVAWVVYSSHSEALERYLESVRIPGTVARAVAAFSIRQVAIFLAFLAAAVALVNLTLRRGFTNSSATVAAAIFGLFLIVDLGIANRPWIIFTDYADQNLTNPVLELLRQQPYEHRVGLVPFRGQSGKPTIVDTAYRADWQLHQFPAFGIESVDVAQMPRMPEDMAAFKKTFDMSTDHLLRKWQLTNTRYLLGDADVANFLNNTMDPAQRRFQVVSRFNFFPRPGVLTVSKVFQLTAQPAQNGPFALIEFTGALPRARLYSQWQTNDASTALEQIVSPAFDPEQTVIVTGDAPAPASGAAQNAGTVTIESYAPKRVELKADAAAPAILLLNDRFDPNWRAYVDGQRQTLLRCNYLMRGVYLPSGSHTVEFRFELPSMPLYVSVATLVAGILLAAVTFVTSHPRDTEKENPKETPQPQRPSPKRNGAAAAATGK